MTIINGKEVSQKLKDDIAAEVKENGYTPGLAVIIVGDDPASRVYVNNKKKACAYCGFHSEEYALAENTTQSELIALIERLNQDENIDGILCQLPLPRHIDEKAVIEAIAPAKDVDAFCEADVGKVMIGNYTFSPCTPAGVMELLKYYHIDVSGKNAVVIGRSNIVGKPMAMLLLHADATVTLCHSKTADLKDICRRADIIVSAVGRIGAVSADMVRDGAVVIDVGINRNSEGKLQGDVDYEAVKEKASYITPVPGGVGPMTIAVLMQNTLKAYKNNKKID
ncbi:MAG: bifunctional methylenetetrahydrofolate dehydrogenase/methenyltetrahydrofolate cyclohydrolase FolD [Clostridia bacterium]|nr:bifunctional methylenetetrahydrofolate dehydrogenase/methenyltetrahydrofolate cyclohydrolase FolD [Clostridia bacterium]